MNELTRCVVNVQVGEMSILCLLMIVKRSTTLVPGQIELLSPSFQIKINNNSLQRNLMRTIKRAHQCQDLTKVRRYIFIDGAFVVTETQDFGTSILKSPVVQCLFKVTASS